MQQERILPAMAVAVVESKGYACDVDTLDQLLAKEEVVADMEEVVLYDFDHKYRVSPSSDPVHDKSPLKVLLYGIIGEEGLMHCTINFPRMLRRDVSNM